MEAEAEQLFGKQLLRKLFVPLLIAVLAYAALLLHGDVGGVVTALRQTPMTTLSGAVVLSLGSFLLRGVRWHLYLRTANISVPILESAMVFLAGLGMSITPGKVGELLKSMLLKEHRDVPIAESAPIIIAERLMDLGALVTLGAMGFAWLHSPAASVLVGVLGFAGFFAIGKSQSLAHAAVGILTRVPRVARYKEKLLTAHRSLFGLWKTGTFILSWTLSLAAWGMQVLIVVLLATGFPPSSVSIPHALVAYTAPLLAGTLALLPGGLGLTEASMAGTLQALSGLTDTVAATLTILVRGVTFWLAVLIGFAALGVWRAKTAPQLAENAEK